MLVRDIMTRRIVSVSPESSCKDAAVLMNENNIGSVPVVDSKGVEGVITDRDIVLRCVAKNETPEKTKVYEVCTKGAICVKPDDELKNAISIMSTQQIRRLPVVESGRLIGMLSIADLAREGNIMEVSEALSDISMP